MTNIDVAEKGEEASNDHSDVLSYTLKLPGQKITSHCFALCQEIQKV